MAYPVPAPVRTISDHYEILCELGAGGMGVVFKAFDTQLRRTVALKFLTQTGPTAAERENVLREARAASVLDHENIGTVHSVEESDGQLFIVMAYYEGESLAARMRRGPLSVEEIRRITRGIASGLGHAHQHGIVHRDIKPSNVILTTEGVPKIIDFGLARFATATATTQSVCFGGTLAYMSPEQIRGVAADARSDLWSLGVILYELLTQRSPFPTDSPGATLEAILHHEPELAGIDPELGEIVRRTLYKDPALRYQSAADLVQDLVRLEAGARDPGGVRSGSGFRKRLYFAALWRHARARWQRHPVAWLAATLLLMAAATGFIYWMTSLRPGPHNTVHVATKPAVYQMYLQAAGSLHRYDKPENLEAGIKTLQAVTADDPAFALGWATLGQAYWLKYRFDRDTKWLDLAKNAGENAAQLSDQLPAVYVTLGLIHGGTGESDLAIQEFQRALEFDNSNADALLGLADVYALVGRAQEAESKYQRAIAMRPEDWIGHNRLGGFYFSQKRWADAVAQFRRVLQLVPDSGMAHGNLGVSLQHLGLLAEAEAELKQATVLRPDYSGFTNLGVMYYRQRRFAEAAQMMERALAFSDKNYVQWDGLAYAYEWLGQKEKAAQARARERELLQELLRIRPQDASAQADLGAVYAQQGLRQQALSHMGAAEALAPKDPDVLERIAEAYEFLGERSRAVLCIKRAIDNGFAPSELELTPNLQALLSDPRMKDVLQPAPVRH